MDLQKPQLGEEPSDTTNYLFSFLVVIIVVIFIGVGVFVGYVLGENKNNQSNNGQNLNQLVTPGPNPSGLQFYDSSQQQSSNNANASGWTLYTDVNFSIKYPVNWLIKKGFSSQSDVVIYDPSSIKQVTQNGQQNRIPTAYVDILSVGAATQSAQEIFDNYKEQASSSAQDEQSPTFGQNMILFNNGNASANTILWTQDGMLAQFSSSIQHLSDSSTENKILQTFQFIK